MKKEVLFLKNMVIENGYAKNNLEKIIQDFSNKNNGNIETDHKKIVKIPWVPGIGPKIKRELKKKGMKNIFTSSRNLEKLICNNKSKLMPN